MRTRLVVIASVMTAAAVIGGVFPVVAPSRRHLRCEPPSNDSGPVARGHLRNDVEAAEEIGVRHGDSRRAIDGRAGEQRGRSDCTRRLLADISARHGIPLADVLALRGERPFIVDAWVLVCIAVGSGVAARHGGATLAARLVDAPVARVGAAVAVSLCGGFVATAALTVFGNVVEIARLWDGHMSYRAGRLPWEQHPWPVFAGATAACLLILVTSRPVDVDA